MLVARNGFSPMIAKGANVAPSATLVGNVRVGPGCYIDYGVTIVSGGPIVDLGPEVVVLANAVVRSVGGAHRPEAPVSIGYRSLVSPGCVLTGALVGANCYIATGAVLLQGAALGDGVRVGAGALVHAGARLPSGEHVGLHHIVVPTADGFISTPDVARARLALAESPFFERVFGIVAEDVEVTNRRAIEAVLAEAALWRDIVVNSPEGSTRSESSARE
jgi:carbonic anhydrase/acetyltransferase-like protein (isoleucine patch superfamily)